MLEPLAQESASSPMFSSRRHGPRAGAPERRSSTSGLHHGDPASDPPWRRDSGSINSLESEHRHSLERISCSVFPCYREHR
jgi:hypothetical protein